MQDCYLWQDGSHSAALNMAVDETLLLTVAEVIKKPVLRLYEWNESATSFGYIQKYEKIPKQGFRVRRMTGGGVVFHDTQFTYTIVLPPEHFILTETKPVESYNITNRGVQAALKKLQLHSSMAQEDIPKHVDRAAMVCFTTPTRYDLLSQQGKIAGAAQRRTKHGLLHQGSIELEKPLTPELLRQHLPQGFAQVLDCTFCDFPEQLKQQVLLDAEKLAAEKYSLPDWNEMR